MTLLGKLFRPWDLTAEENSIKSGDSNCSLKLSLSSGESDPKSSPDVLSDLKRCFNFGDRQNSQIRNDASIRDREEVHASRSKSYVERRDSRRESVNKTVPVQDEQGDKCPMSFMELESMVGYNVSQEAASSLFLHPTAINDLANLSRIELTAMGLLPPDPPTLKVKRQRPKRFHCPHCQVAFSNNGQLRGHIRIHTGERPFSCEYEGCGKSFTRNEELTRHRRIHSGLRPFPCTYCGKKFGRKDHLKKHTRTHQRPMFNPAAGMIGFGNPFHPFNPPLMSSHPTINEFSSVQPSYALPFVLSVPPPSSHFPFS